MGSPFKSDFVAREKERRGFEIFELFLLSSPFLFRPFLPGRFAGPSSCCLDLPLRSDRFLNLPLIPRLFRFFSFFFLLSFPPFHLFVVLLLFLLLLLVFLSTSSSSLLSPPFCTISPRLAILSPALLVGERSAPTGFELSRNSRGAASNCGELAASSSPRAFSSLERSFFFFFNISRR